MEMDKELKKMSFFFRFSLCFALALSLTPPLGKGTGRQRSKEVVYKSSLFSHVRP